MATDPVPLPLPGAGAGAEHKPVVRIRKRKAIPYEDDDADAPFDYVQGRIGTDDAHLHGFPWLNGAPNSPLGNAELGQLGIAEIVMSGHARRIPSMVERLKRKLEPFEMNFLYSEACLPIAAPGPTEFRDHETRYNEMLLPFHAELVKLYGRSKRFKKMIRHVRRCLRVRQGELILEAMYWQHFQYAYEVHGGFPVLLNKFETVVRRSDLTRLKKKASEIVKRRESVIDLDGVVTRGSQAMGPDTKYMMAEIMAVAPSLGNEKRSALIATVIQMALYRILGPDGRNEGARVAEVVAALTPSPSSWSRIPPHEKTKIPHLPIADEQEHKHKRSRLKMRSSKEELKHRAQIMHERIPFHQPEERNRGMDSGQLSRMMHAEVAARAAVVQAGSVAQVQANGSMGDESGSQAKMLESHGGH